MALVQKLDEASLEAFSKASKDPFATQAQFFLNAFWEEYSSHAEAIYTIAWALIKKADMTHKGTMYVHLYQEDSDLDFDMALHFFELLTNYFADKKNAKDVATYPLMVPIEMTAVHRKKELRDKVDVNFDGRVSLLEYLCYQFGASPKMLMERSMAAGDLPEEVLKALAALEEVNKRIRLYEAEKQRLTDESALPGIKGLKAKNELAQLNAGVLWENLNVALITAEAAVRIAKRKYGVAADAQAGQGGAAAGAQNIRTNGTLWWLDRELKTKQELYGPRNKN